MQALIHMVDLEASRKRIRQDGKWLSHEITARGLYCHPSSVNFILVECKSDVAPLCACLSEHLILVRDCTSFGMPTCVRIAVRTHDENILLLEAIAACLP